MKRLFGQHTETIAGVLILVCLAIAPFLIDLFGSPFLLSLLTRLVILAIAAVSLNLILGYGGMISFGHAAYFGIGAYCVGIPAYYDNYDGFQHLLLALAGGALFALVTGAICLRMKGVHFIMITMAFAQMMFFAFVSIEEYGGDDGLVIYSRSEFAGLLDISNNTNLYYLCLASLIVALFIVHRLVNSRFGMVIQGARSNDRRMRSLGFPTYRYQLVCFIIAGSMCSYAGMLHANYSDFISPDVMDWTRSGELIFMVVLGGVMRLYGPLFGVVIFIVLEEYLSSMIEVFADGYGEYWHFVFGVILVLVVMFVRGGVSGLLRTGQAG